MQVEAERDYDYIGKREVVRIKWRDEGERRWSKRIVIPDDDHSVGYIIQHAREYAEAIKAAL